MSSLKEVKTRIESIRTTRKITQARQMISSAQLHQSQGLLASAQVYRQALEAMAVSLAGRMPESAFPLCQKQETGEVALIMMASNNGMCGAFNARMIKEWERLKTSYPNRRLQLYPVGKKIREVVLQDGFPVQGNFDHLAGKPEYQDVYALAATLIHGFCNGTIKQVDVVSYHFRNLAVQDVVHQSLLPYTFPESSQEQPSGAVPDYILEPSPAEIIETLLPQLVGAHLYEKVIDNQTSEFAARSMAMQLATENADELLEDLQRSYNKLRQQNITSELLDIIGGSFA